MPCPRNENIPIATSNTEEPWTKRFGDFLLLYVVRTLGERIHPLSPKLYSTSAALRGSSGAGVSVSVTTYLAGYD